ncbi:MAG: hypothetical protein LBG80_12785 [Bacteroidales bacterium]|jgi:hypothetical protein|nr:hypothetical protein [Bacteroidales bacterium]
MGKSSEQLKIENERTSGQVDKWTSEQVNRTIEVEMKNVLKINAGTACSDRANEVEPRPNGRQLIFLFSYILINASEKFYRIAVKNNFIRLCVIRKFSCIFAITLIINKKTSQCTGELYLVK